jgi:hypothetical protein
MKAMSPLVDVGIIDSVVLRKIHVSLSSPVIPLLPRYSKIVAMNGAQTFVFLEPF